MSTEEIEEFLHYCKNYKLLILDDKDGSLSLLISDLINQPVLNYENNVFELPPIDYVSIDYVYTKEFTPTSSSIVFLTFDFVISIDNRIVKNRFDSTITFSISDIEKYSRKLKLEKIL